MKILDKYLLKTFLITFTTVFVILFFIFILQGIWLFISELAGKDLDFIFILKFIVYYMPTIVPLVLPLSILLSSIMTFGDLSEHYEFAAMKSAGVSLQRAMKSLIVFIVFLSFGAFFFANNVIPYSQYKFANFRRNIAQVKPAMAITEGQFSKVGDYSIKVDRKSGEKGNFLEGITIHRNNTNGSGNTMVIKARNGVLKSSEESNILQLVMRDGCQYEDLKPVNYNEQQKMPFTKTTFTQYVVNMDLSKLNNVDANQMNFTTNAMLDVKHLRYTLDSLNKTYKKDVVSFADNINQRTGISNFIKPKFEIKIDNINNNKVLKPKKTIIKSAKNINLLQYYSSEEQLRIIETAKSNLVGTTFSINSNKSEMEFKNKNLNAHWVALYDKFVMGFACLLMFFIGAPLGAIIRKGGLGMPIVFAILIFISFHFINTFGRKVAEENGITPFLGSWMSSLILTPLAVLLTFRATNDIGLINLDNILLPFQKLMAKLFPQNNNL